LHLPQNKERQPKSSPESNAVIIKALLVCYKKKSNK
jgi:hypothetical protein